MFVSLRHLLLRLGRWPRLLAAAACLLFALLTAAESRAARAHARTPDTVPVLVATRALAAGTLLRAADVRVESWPRRLRPDRSLARPHDIEGHRAGAPLDRGEPVTAARMSGGGLTAGLPAGTGAVPVPVTASALTLVRPGDRVDVYAATGDTLEPDASADSHSTGLVADDVLVLSALHGVADEPPALVVAADRATAVKLAQRNPLSVFTVVARSP